MKIVSKLAALFLGTTFAVQPCVPAFAATHAEDKLSCRNDVPAAFLVGHPIDMCWQHPGGKPAFKNREDAMAHRREIFEKFKNADGTAWSAELIAFAVEQTSKAPTSKVMITNRNWFNDMAEGGMIVRQHVSADFKEEPKGITSRTGGLFLWADVWEFVWHGVKYRIFLPEICFNWADKVYESAPPPPPPPATERCREVRVKVNAGDVLLVGVRSSHHLRASTCLAQQKPGETHFETDFRIEACTTCKLEEDITETYAPSIVRNTELLIAPRETFQATQNGYYVLRLPEGDEIPIFCDHRADGLNSWSKYVLTTNFVDDVAYLVYMPEKVPEPWHGSALQWDFKRPY